MGNQSGFGIHFVFFILLSTATTNTCLGSRNITIGCTKQEGEALLKFKQSLINDSNMLSSWIGTDCCQWEGVDCDGATRSVVGLHLRSRFDSSLRKRQNLVAHEVNPTLAKLGHLKYLDLSWNKFHGRIPEFIGSLKHLNYFNLSYNQFSGIIPHHIGNLSSLKVLDLSSHSYPRLEARDIAWISGLSTLEHLDLSGVNLSLAHNFDSVLYMIPSLTELSLSYCEISDVDLVGAHLNSSRMLPNIRHLDFSDNAIEGKFAHILMNLSSLLSLDLSYNYLNSQISVVPSLVKLDLSYNTFEQIDLIVPFTNASESSKYALEILNLRNNNLKGSIPDSLGGFIDLRVLQLSSNNLEGQIPEALGKLRLLKVCDVSSNQLTGPIPTFLGQLTILDLSKNRLNGTIPEPLGRLTALRHFSLSSNQLTGPIPTFLGQLTTLDLSENRLNGMIPESLGKLTALRYLSLSSNQLTGPIPASMGRLTALRELKLSSNRLTSPIPTSMGRLASLETFSAFSNMLNGTIPVSIGKLKKLGDLDLSNNSFEGMVFEAHFANLSMLKYLDISLNSNLTFNVSHKWIPPFQLRTVRSCKIANEFPPWFRTQKKLQELWLSNSSIHGPLPAWLQNLSSISVLDLSHNTLNGPLTNLPFQKYGYGVTLLLQNNRFNGSIPRLLCSWIDLQHLDLSNNRLTGNIPNCLAELYFLSTLILSSNRLSGVIPSSLIQYPTSLIWLNLNDNNLTGELPQNIVNASFLKVLDVGDNKMSGNIPKRIGELKSLVVLRIHNNNFSGRLPPSLCKNSNLQILDVAYNSLTGAIPHCLGELNGMIKGSAVEVHNGSSGPDAMVIQVIKGVALEYTTTLQLVVNMDLSSNKLVGKIPEELTRLSLLVGLNLSHNHLTGGIPDSIGNMKALNSLDFSDNNLTGRIPSSMADLNFLSRFNLSQNNFSGRIPTGNQLQTLLDPSIYAGNRDLCGAPLPKNCSNPEDQMTTKSENKHKHANEAKKIWFYMDIVCGFATGFWGVIGVLLLNERLRQKFFMLGEVAMHKIHVTIMVLR